MKRERERERERERCRGLRNERFNTIQENEDVRLR